MQHVGGPTATGAPVRGDGAAAARRALRLHRPGAAATPAAGLVGGARAGRGAPEELGPTARLPAAPLSALAARRYAPVRRRRPPCDDTTWPPLATGGVPQHPPERTGWRAGPATPIAIQACRVAVRRPEQRCRRRCKSTTLRSSCMVRYAFWPEVSLAQRGEPWGGKIAPGCRRLACRGARPRRRGRPGPTPRRPVRRRRRCPSGEHPEVVLAVVGRDAGVDRKVARPEAAPCIPLGGSCGPLTGPPPARPPRRSRSLGAPGRRCSPR